MSLISTSAMGAAKYYTPASANDTFNSDSNWSTTTTGGSPDGFVANAGVPTAVDNAGDQAEFTANALGVNGISGPVTVDLGADQSVTALAFRTNAANDGTLTQDITFNNNKFTLYGLANSNAIVYQAQNLVTINSDVSLATNVIFFSGGNASKGVVINGDIGETGGSFGFTKTQAGRLVVNGDITATGAISVSAGTLILNGNAPGRVSATSGGTIGGSGTIAGELALSASGTNFTTLAPGDRGPGTLTVGSLDLPNIAPLRYDLDVPGLGPTNDLVIIGGDLRLNGVLSVTAGTSFGVGTYTLMTYGGVLDDRTVTFGTMPSGFNYEISTTTPGQVNLIVSAVPEPASLAAFGAFAVVACRRGRRSRR